MAKFTDIQLIQILQKSARRVNRKLCLTGTTDEIVVNNNGEVSTPDDSDLHDILLLQAECISQQREHMEELRDADGGVLVVDGEQRVDTRSVGIARGAFFETPHNPCSELAQAITLEKLRRQCGRLIY